MNKELYRAAESDDVKALQRLRSQDVDILSEVSHAGNSALHIAAFHGSTKFIKMLLEQIRHSDVERQSHGFLTKQNVDGNTVLHEAASGGKAEIVDDLLKHSPEHWRELASVKNKAGETAVFKAALAGHTDIIEMFEKLWPRRCTSGNSEMGIAKLAKHHYTVPSSTSRQIKKLLESYGAVRNAKVVTEAELPKPEKYKSKWKTEIISWNAVLIGTVAFAAPFSLLGNKNPLDGDDFKSKSIPQCERNFYVFLFYLFFLSDTVALGTSVASTILLLFAVFGDKEDKPMVQTSFMAVMVALLAILIAFGSGLALFLGPKYLWLTLTIWFMLCVTPLAIRVRTFHSKLYLFTETQNFIRFVVEDTLGLIIMLIYHILDIVGTLCWEGLILPGARLIFPEAQICKKKS